MVDLQNLFLQIYLMTAGSGTLPYIVNNGPRRNHRSSYRHRHLRMRGTAIHLRISYLPSSSCTIFSLTHAIFPFPHPNEARTAYTTDVSQYEVGMLDIEWKAGHAV